jgi:PAS domain S-box-containing protein
LFQLINFQKELEPILSYLSEVCSVQNAFFTLLEGNTQSIKAYVGSSPNEDFNVSDFLNLIDNEISIASEFGLLSEQENRGDNFNFFAGIPLLINNETLGALCIADSLTKTLSLLEFKILKQAAQQIESILLLLLQKEILQKELDLRNEHIQTFANNTNEIIYELDINGKFIFVSKGFTTLLGYEMDEVVGKGFDQFVHPEDIESCFIFLNNVVLTGKSDEEITYRVFHKDGSIRWHTSQANKITNAELSVYSGHARDVTESIESNLELLKQRNFYEKILDRLPIAVAVFDRNHKYTYLNPTSIVNKELRAFIVGKDDYEYAIHTNRETAFAEVRWNKFEEAVATKKSLEWEDILKQPDGELIYHIRKYTPVFDEDGDFEMMVGFGINITESKKDQVEILESKQLIQSILQNVAIGILVQGPQSEMLESNKAALEMLGLTEDQLLGKTSFDSSWRVIHEDRSNFKAEDHPVPKAIQLRKPVNKVVMGVFHYQLNDFVWLLVDAMPVFNDNQELIYVVCTFNDITELKKAEESLKISNERFDYSSKATSDALWDWDLLTDEIYVGEAYTNLFGYQFENNIIAANLCETFVHPDDLKAYNEDVEEAIDSGLSYFSEEYRYLKSDGNYAYVNDRAIIIRNEKGKAIRIIGAMQDITQKKKLENKLLQSEARFRGAFDYSAVGMAIVNSNFEMIEINDQFCIMLGYSKKELKKLRFHEITHPDDLEIDMDEMEKIISGEINNFHLEKRYLHKDKSIVWGHLSVSAVKNANGEITNFLGQVINITERKRIEQLNIALIEENNRNKTIQLNEAKDLYRLLAQNTVDLVCLHNLDATFQYVSPSITNLLGYNPEEMIGKSPIDFVFEEDLALLKKTFHEIFEKDFVAEEFRFKNSSGNYIWLEINAATVKKNGEIIGYQSSNRNIKQRKENEVIIENALQKERQLNELRSNLVSTVSHEFRTPMTTIRVSSELIALYLEKQVLNNSEKLNKHLKTITSEIDRITDLMNSVLIISKDDSGKTTFNPTKVDLKQLCKDVIETSFANQKDGRKVIFNPKDEPFTIHADKNLMEYSLFNLLNNAFKYSIGTPNIVLNLYNELPNIVVLEVIDFGIGIPESDQSKLFNTFFRASNSNGIEGTGLGLYIVKTFIEKNGGAITLESKLGKGTKVTVNFPI